MPNVPRGFPRDEREQEDDNGKEEEDEEEEEIKGRRGRRGREEQTMIRRDAHKRRRSRRSHPKAISCETTTFLRAGFLVLYHHPRTETRGVGSTESQPWKASRVPIFGSVGYSTADVISGVATLSSFSRSSAARRFTTHPHG